MLKTLLKKQMLELNQNFFQNKKNGKSRSRLSVAAFIVLYLLLLVFLGGIFFYMGINLCKPLWQAGLGWLYFVIMGVVAVALGVFGSVFNTFASLYQAKDNDMLLSMPIPVSAILIVRLSGVYAMGLLFSAIVMIPTVIVYVMEVNPGMGGILAGVIWILLISVFVLTLSCILGWVVARINSRLKNKSMITVVVSLVFFAAYYYVYFKASDLLKMLLTNSTVVGMKIKGYAYPLYWSGRAAEGDLLSLAMFAVMVLVSFAVVYFVLAHSFLKLVTSHISGKKVVYQEKVIKTKSQKRALIVKELGRFLASPTYMLNCALGIVFLVVMGVTILVKGDAITQMLGQVFPEKEDFVAALSCFAICLVSMMNDITAPSISLEGKNLWISRSLPVSSAQVLQAKLQLQLVVTAVPVLFCSICVVIVLPMSVTMAVATLLLPQLFNLLIGQIGLAINLKMPNLNWSNEAAAVKQSAGVLLTMLVGFCYSAVVVVIYLFQGDQIETIWYLFLCVMLTTLFIFLMKHWIKTKGTVIFENLS